MAWQTRWQHLSLALGCVPSLLRDGQQRRRLAEMRHFCRRLPTVLAQPIPQAMAALTPTGEGKRPFFPEATTRHLADLAALLERHSPVGLCLRRSLIRYHYLRQLDIPVVVQFGAKLVPGKQQKEIAGHAWLTLQDAPYYEAEENWRDFTVMFTWPEA